VFVTEDADEWGDVLMMGPSGERLRKIGTAWR
jgi:hypothetical protein